MTAACGVTAGGSGIASSEPISRNALRIQAKQTVNRDRRLRMRAITDDSESSFIPERFNRIDPRSLNCGIHAEQDAHRDGYAKCNHH